MRISNRLDTAEKKMSELGETAVERIKKEPSGRRLKFFKKRKKNKTKKSISDI